MMPLWHPDLQIDKDVEEASTRDIVESRVLMKKGKRRRILLFS
jgi:hypothetical protein